jgi:hypothetical protein
MIAADEMPGNVADVTFSFGQFTALSECHREGNDKKEVLIYTAVTNIEVSKLASGEG